MQMLWLISKQEQQDKTMDEHVLNQISDKFKTHMLKFWHLLGWQIV